MSEHVLDVKCSYLLQANVWIYINFTIILQVLMHLHSTHTHTIQWRKNPYTLFLILVVSLLVLSSLLLLLQLSRLLSECNTFHHHKHIIESITSYNQYVLVSIMRALLETLRMETMKMKWMASKWKLQEQSRTHIHTDVILPVNYGMCWVLVWKCNSLHYIL